MLLFFFSLIISLHRATSNLKDLRLGSNFNFTRYYSFLHSWGQAHTGTDPGVIVQANNYYLRHLSVYNEKISDKTKGENVIFFSTPESCPDTAYGVPLWNPPRRVRLTESCLTELSDKLTRHNLAAARRPAVRGYHPIHGFFHITLNVTTFLSRQENATIFETQLQKLNKSGLLEESSLTLKIGLLDIRVNLKRTLCVKEMIKRRVAVFAAGAEIEWVNPLDFECGTILSMQEWCSKNEQSYVYYLHNKGITHMSDHGLFMNVKQWREFMMFFLFERWTLCANSLAHGAATCGVHIALNPYTHYKGNFWWSSCNHMVRVTNRCPRGISFRHAAEFWLMANTGLFTDVKEAVELWSGQPSFFRPYPRDEYSCADLIIQPI